MFTEVTGKKKRIGGTIYFKFKYPLNTSLGLNRSWGKQSYAFEKSMNMIPVNLELSSSFEKRQDTCWPIVTFISGIFFLVDMYYIWDNLLVEIASFTQQVKYSRVNPLSFKILIEISPAVALFEGNLFVTSFAVCTLIGWRKALCGY